MPAVSIHWAAATVPTPPSLSAKARWEGVLGKPGIHLQHMDHKETEGKSVGRKKRDMVIRPPNDLELISHFSIALTRQDQRMESKEMLKRGYPPSQGFLLLNLRCCGLGVNRGQSQRKFTHIRS